MSFWYSSSIQWAQFVPGYLPSLKPRLLLWAKSGRYVKAIKKLSCEGHSGIFFLSLFFNCSCHFTFSHNEPNVRTSCTDSNFWYIFLCYKWDLSIKFSSALLISVIFISAPCRIQYKHSDVLWRLFFFFHMSPSWREGVILLPTSTFLDNLGVDDPEKETVGDPSFD